MNLTALIRSLTFAAGIAAASFSTAGATVSTGLEIADHLSPLQVLSIPMENFTAVVNYTVTSEGTYEVVTTIGPNTDVEGVTTQHHATLEVGQSYLLGLDQGVGAAPLTALRFTATPDNLLVAKR